MIFSILGAESVLVKEALDKLLAERLDPASKDFNFDIFEAGSLEIKKVASAIGTLPVLAARRIVLIKSAHELKKGETESLTDLLDQVPETTDLIFVAEKADARTTFWQKLTKKAKTTEIRPPEPREAPHWVVQEARKAGYLIDAAAASWMVAAIGSDLAGLRSALEKIFLLKGAQKQISLQDVESCVTAVSWKTVFELTDAVGARKLDRALQLFKRMEESGESPIAMLALLARHFRILSKVKEGDSGGVPPFFLKDYQRQAGQFDATKLAEKREKLFQTDWALKSSPIDKNLLFERLLMDLCR
jgi:DNA polymerase-3 subunit delta